MKEEIVKQIFEKYLESFGKQIKTKPRTAAGPDFIVEGKAYECKGSKFNERGLFAQVLQYAFQFSVVGLVLPYDVITFELIWKLEATENFIQKGPGLERCIEIFLVAEAEDQEYAICRFSSPRALNGEVSSILYNLIPEFASIGSIEEKEKKILEFLENIEARIKEEFKKRVLLKAKEVKSPYDGGIFSLSMK
jgi:hypothetical protein